MKVKYGRKTDGLSTYCLLVWALKTDQHHLFFPLLKLLEFAIIIKYYEVTVFVSSYKNMTCGTKFCSCNTLRLKIFVYVARETE